MTIRFLRRMTSFVVLAMFWSAPARSSEPVLVEDLNPGGSSGPTALQSAGGRLFFQADDGEHGVELWVSDGTAAGTAMVRDILAGVQGAYPRGFAGLGEAVYFSANDGALGHELWRTDGTETGTVLVRDLNPGVADSWPGVASGWFAAGDRLFFVGYTNTAGYELWRTDGTPGGTALVQDINQGNAGSSALGFAALGETVFFRADDGVPQGNHRELWKSDGTEQGTVMVKDINPLGESDPTGLTVLNGVLLFEANDGAHGNELWRSDGTEEGTVLLKDIHPAGSSFPGQLRSLNGTVYFVANDGTNGSELWRSDGTEIGTEMVVDLNPSGSSPITSLTVVGDALFFVLRAGSFREELWTSDGTAAGTVMLEAFTPQNYHPMVENLTDVAGTLFFTANDGVHGVELWRSDGSSAGTVLAGDIHPGDEWSFSWPDYLRNVGGILFFSADDGVHGRELWMLDSRGTTGIPAAAGAPGPDGLRLEENAPNPFQQATALRFDLPAAATVSVRVYDAAGRHVRKLVAGQRMGAGANALRWDGRNDEGRDMQSGIYFYRLETEAGNRVGRMVLAR